MHHAHKYRNRPPPLSHVTKRIDGFKIRAHGSHAFPLLTYLRTHPARCRTFQLMIPWPSVGARSIVSLQHAPLHPSVHETEE
jgi:hypothetical protein